MNIFLIISLLFCNCFSEKSSFLRESFACFFNSFNDYLFEKGFETFKTSKVEFSRTISDSNGTKYFYLDFAGNNGFILVRDDDTIVLYDARCDIPYLRNHTDVYYSDYDFITPEGSLNWKSNNNYNDRNRTFVPGQIALQYPNAIEYNSLSSYLSSKYSSFSVLYSYSVGKLSGMLSTMNSEGYLEYSESVYHTYINNWPYSEGNCGLVSCANAISYYAHYTNLLPTVNYSDYDYITPLVDEPNYVSIVSGYNYFPKGTTVAIHSISNAIRLNAIQVEYYCCGLDDNQTEYAFEETISDYGCIGTFVTSDVNSSLFSISSIKNEIDNNRPMQLRVNDDVYYGGHGMMVTGYNYFRGEDWIHIGPPHHGYNLQIEYFLPFLSIYDGLSSNERWFDLTALSNLGSDYVRSSYQSLATLEVGEVA